MSKDDARKARLAAALRDNLKRRKARRADDEATRKPEPPDPSEP